ncbi:Hypothetical protein PENO1_073360 [Penicillium occitanis (nom. inval.)]|nr:hypothetical protein PENOC_085490 [Penicillium occitanis (nom. inval.)]PCG95456.1 Hypothetical protein PENO1_073360 [Penicillium occitanis (nom. inval.)]
MSSTGTLSPDAYVAAGTPLIAICAGFVVVRCFISVRVCKKLPIDDYISIFGLALVTVAFAMNDVIIKRFTDPTASISWLLMVAVVITVIVAFTLWATKVPILIVYIKIFGIKKWVRYICYTCIAVGVAYICVMGPRFMRCHPGSQSMTELDLAYCVTGTTLTGVISGFIALAEDMLIFILPMPLIYQLRLAPGKRLAVATVFFTGILAIAASVVSLYFKYRAYNGETSDTLATMLCAVLEGTIAIIVGCVPAVKNFWSTIFSSRRYINIKAGRTTSFNNNISRPNPTFQLDDESESTGLSHAHDGLPST